MSPKITDYPIKDRKKIIETSIGTGVGYATAEEKAEYKTVKPLIFKLINLASLAAQAEQGEEVIPFKKGTAILIQNHKGIIGEAPYNVVNLIVKILNRNLRFSGRISSIVKGEKGLSIEVTLIVG